RELSKDQRVDYVNAVKCLQTLPSKSDPALVPGARTRYDDFHGVHITNSLGLLDFSGGIHLVGQFLPWHRYFIIAYETALRNECGYKGYHPYWNWTLDSGPGKDVRNSPVFDDKYGFGGNGAVAPTPPDTFSSTALPGGTGNGCVVSGPFKDMVLNIGPGPNVTYNPRCLSRSINPEVANKYLSTPNVTPLWSTKNYDEFSTMVEGDQKMGSPPIITFHGAGHYVIGGEANDFISSNADPTFYLHHAFVDALWTKWQNMDITGKRLYEISGPTKPFDTAKDREEVTLNYKFPANPVSKEITISKVINIGLFNTGGVGCYKYQF
ncbi:hypothetical protein DFH27DRAFT_489060, partial [Peziza echinospora]